MKLITDDISSWTNSLADFKPEYVDVKCWSVLQFFQLEGRKSVIKKENIVPIDDLYLALYSPQEKKYYYKEYRGYDIDIMYLRRLESDEWKPELDSLRRYISDGNLYLLLTESQIQETVIMLERLYKSHFVGLGKVPYKIWIQLLQLHLDYEDYRDYGANLTGYKTVCHTFEIKIKELWDKCYKN